MPEGPQEESIGSVGEEAAKLMGVLSEWARDQREAGAQTAGDALSGMAHAAHDVHEHIATDSPECRYCPLCRVISLVRGTSPEVREHLTIAAGSLLQAASGLLATYAPASDKPRAAGVEKIDLEDDEGDEPL